MKAKLVRNVKKLAAVATGALFVGATLGMASVFASGLSSLPGPFVSSGHVNAVFVVGANAAPTDILGAIDVSAALTASAAATHSSVSTGQVTIGTLVLSSKAHSVNNLLANATALNSFSPSSINLYATNFTSGKSNFTSVENLTFTKTSEFNGLNVQFPVGAYVLQSYIVNRNASVGYHLGTVNMVNFTSIVNASYEFGNSALSLLSLNAKNASFGVAYTKSNVPIPGSLPAGTNTVNLVGVAKVLTSTGSINEIEFNINGGTTQVANLSSTVTVGKVTLTIGKTILENSTGYFLSSLDVSSASLIQNSTNAKAVFPGLGAFNVTFSPKNGGMFNLNATSGFMLQHSFTAATGFSLPENLTSISLEKLMPVYSAAANQTVTVGAAKLDFIYPTLSLNASSGSLAGLSYNNSALSGVAFGTDFRGPLTTNGTSGPDLLLEHYQSIYNVSSGEYVNASSEYIFPRINQSNPSYYNNNTALITKKANAVSYGLKSKGAIVRFIYEMPTGNDLALQFSNITAGLKDFVPNMTQILNYTSSTTSNPTIITPKLGSLRLEGYNLTIGKFSFNESGSIQKHVNATNFYGDATLGNSAYINASIGKSGNNASIFNKTGLLILPKGSDVYVYTNRTTHVQLLPLNSTVLVSPNSSSKIFTNLSISQSTVPGYANVTNSSLRLAYDSNATRVYNTSINSSTASSKISAFNSTLTKYVTVNASTVIKADWLAVNSGDKFGVKNISVNLTTGVVSPSLLKGNADVTNNKNVTLNNGTLVLNQIAPVKYSYNLSILKGTLTNTSVSSYLSNVSNGLITVGKYTNKTLPVAKANVEFINGTADPGAATELYYARLSGPTASINADSSTYDIVPNHSGLYAVNGTAISSIPVKNSAGASLGTLTFNGSELTFTDPIGGVQSVMIAENSTNFNTKILTTANTSANTWGDYLLSTPKKNTSTIVVPSQNYTLAVAGSQVISGQRNYTVGQSVSTGKLLGISGVSTVSASQLLNGNVDLTTLDSNFTGATNDVPVIVIGGPAINTLADTLLNSSVPVYGSNFTKLTNVSANEALIEMFNNVTAFNSQPALWIAGYSGQDTLEAAEVLASSLIGQPIVNLTGNKVILSTSSSTYKGVSIAS